MEIVSALKPFQIINHFPSMIEISRNDLLARNFDKYIYFIEFHISTKVFFSLKDYHVYCQMNTTIHQERGCYQMNIMLGIHMHRVNQNQIQLPIFSNQIMVLWAMGRSFSLIQTCFNCYLSIEFKFAVSMNEFNQWIITLFKNIFKIHI